MDKGKTYTHGELPHEMHIGRFAIANAREMERRKLARELHDTVIQPLTALLMSISQLESQPSSAAPLETNLGTWRGLAQEALDSLRSALTGLQPHMHGEDDLPEKLRCTLAAQFRTRGVQLSVESDGWPTDLPASWNSNLYLVVREAVTNAEKHAQASMVNVRLRADADNLSITVEDDGRGIPWAELDDERRARPGSGLGIGCMRDRVTQLDGQMDITTTPGGGLRIAIWLPYPARMGRSTGDAVRGVASEELITASGVH